MFGERVRHSGTEQEWLAEKVSESFSASVARETPTLTGEEEEEAEECNGRRCIAQLYRRIQQDARSHSTTLAANGKLVPPKTTSFECPAFSEDVR